MKKNYYAKALALTVAASMVSVPAFAAEGTDDPQAQEKTVEQDEQKGEKSAEEEQEKIHQNRQPFIVCIRKPVPAKTVIHHRLQSHTSLVG